jgi:hypothetical protein
MGREQKSAFLNTGREQGIALDGAPFKGGRIIKEYNS